MSAPSTYHDRLTCNAVSQLGKVYQLKIKEIDYSGSSTEVRGSAIPFSRSLKGDNDVMEDRILRSTLKFSIEDTEEGAFRDLFTSDWRKYCAELWRDSVIYWCGFISPDYYSEPWTALPYPITVECHDGLGQLKSIDLTDSLGHRFTGKVSIAEIVGNCLWKILPFTTLYEGINLLAENQDPDKSALTEIYMQAERFYHDGMISCYDALTECLKICNAQILQIGSIWWIVSIGARKGEFVRKLFTISTNSPNSTTKLELTWTIAASGTYDPVTSITDKTVADNLKNFWWETPTMTILPGWKNFVVKHEAGFKENLFIPESPYGDAVFEEYFAGDSIELSHFGQTGRRVKHFDEYTIAFRTVNIQPLYFNLGYYDTSDEQILKFDLDFRNNVLILSPIVDFISVRFHINGSQILYLKSDGTWSTSIQNTYRFTHDLLTPVSIQAKTLPISGTLFMEVKYENIDDHVPITQWDKFTAFFNKSTVKISILGVDIIESIEITTTINNNQNFIPEEQTMMFADFLDVPNKVRIYEGGLWYKVDSDTWGVTDKWYVRGSTLLKPLVNLIADEIGIMHTRPTWMISGQLFGNINPMSTILDSFADRKFIIIRMDENCYDDEFDMDIIEISPSEPRYLKLKQGGYLKLKSGGQIKLH